MRIEEDVGNFEVGKVFDAVVLDGACGGNFDAFPNETATETLEKLVHLGTGAAGMRAAMIFFRGSLGVGAALWPGAGWSAVSRGLFNLGNLTPLFFRFLCKFHSDRGKHWGGVGGGKIGLSVSKLTKGASRSRASRCCL